MPFLAIVFDYLSFKNHCIYKGARSAQKFRQNLANCLIRKAPVGVEGAKTLKLKGFTAFYAFLLGYMKASVGVEGAKPPEAIWFYCSLWVYKYV